MKKNKEIILCTSVVILLLGTLVYAFIVGC